VNIIRRIKNRLELDSIENPVERTRAKMRHLVKDGWSEREAMMLLLADGLPEPASELVRCEVELRRLLRGSKINKEASRAMRFALTRAWQASYPNEL
jgi:hypothetical protein